MIIDHINVQWTFNNVDNQTIPPLCNPCRLQAVIRAHLKHHDHSQSRSQQTWIGLPKPMAMKTSDQPFMIYVYCMLPYD